MVSYRKPYRSTTGSLPSRAVPSGLKCKSYSGGAAAGNDDEMAEVVQPRCKRVRRGAHRGRPGDVRARAYRLTAWSADGRVSPLSAGWSAFSVTLRRRPPGRTRGRGLCTLRSHVPLSLARDRSVGWSAFSATLRRRPLGPDMLALHATNPRASGRTHTRVALAAAHAYFAFTGLHCPHPSPLPCVFSPDLVTAPRWPVLGGCVRGGASLHGPAAR
eukprot:6987965-Prymnesium_polylepis.1